MACGAEKCIQLVQGKHARQRQNCWTFAFSLLNHRSPVLEVRSHFNFFELSELWVYNQHLCPSHKLCFRMGINKYFCVKFILVNKYN